MFSPALAALVLGEFRKLAKASSGVSPLSEREREVLQLVARGHSYREIGARLFIAEKTVENDVRNILAKLHLSRRQELIRYALGARHRVVSRSRDRLTAHPVKLPG